MMTKRAIVLAIAAFAFAANDAKPATAQAYPSRIVMRVFSSLLPIALTVAVGPV